MITSSNIILVLTRQSGLPLDQDFLIFLVLSGLVKKVQIIIMLDKQVFICHQEYTKVNS